MRTPGFLMARLTPVVAQQTTPVEVEGETAMFLVLFRLAALVAWLDVAGTATLARVEDFCRGNQLTSMTRRVLGGVKKQAEDV